MAVQFIIDSGSDVLPNKAQEMGLVVLPLKVMFGATEYRDGEDMTHREFYERLIESEQLPTTCQVPPADYEQAYQRVADSGDTAVVITLSSKLSRTYQSAVIASGEYEDGIFVVENLLDLCYNKQNTHMPSRKGV